MKTIKIRVELAGDGLDRFHRYCEDLGWVWNQCRRVALHNHAVEWYRLYQGKYGLDMDGAISVPLRLGKRSAWSGAACQIAVGGPYWKKDDKNTITVVRDGKTRHYPTHQLVDGDQEYTPVAPVAYSPIEVLGKQITSVKALDSMARLNAMRMEQELPPLDIHSDFVGGLIKDFEAAWAAYLAPKLPQRHQPRFRSPRNPIESLSNPQNPPRWKAGAFHCCGLQLVPCDRTWQERLGELVPRSYRIIQRPSGTYLCISAATASECLRPTLVRHRNTLSGQIKRAAGRDKKSQAAALAASEEYQAAAEALVNLEAQIEQERFDASTSKKPSTIIAGIDPGVRVVVATDHGALFNPNLSRLRIQAHIEQLQSRLDLVRERNDKKLGKSWRRGERPPTNNEAKLQAKISRLHERGTNSTRAFNAKLAVRLTRTYGEIRWEDNDLDQMIDKAEPLLGGPSHYLPNGGTQQTRLNKIISLSAIGGLQGEIERRATAARKTFTLTASEYGSMDCHACGWRAQENPRRKPFVCQNPGCGQFRVPQHPDINAALNAKK